MNLLPEPEGSKTPSIKTIDNYVNKYMSGKIMGSSKSNSLLKLEARFKRFKEKQTVNDEDTILRLPKIEHLEEPAKTPSRTCSKTSVFTFVKNDIEDDISESEIANLKISHNFTPKLSKLHIEKGVLLSRRLSKIRS